MPVPPSPPLLPSKILLLFAALVVAAAGCKPKIGDDCQISTDCSASADRLCDITAPAGYCTVFNCEPGTCPDEESLCVQFGAQRSPVAACQDLHSPSPYARTFCMAVCEGDDDCRDGYQCANLKNDNYWGALLIDRDRGDKACVVKSTAEEVDPDGSGNVCHAELPSESGSNDSAGAGGAPGAVGSSGAGGAPSSSAGAAGAPSAAAPAAAGQGGAEAGGAGG